ncbi:MAG TPA: PAS domain-containing protein, partial [Chitinophagales bacterium]|nr:PAS domain-containing protein [Chitinophagales bacterium]
MYLDPRTIIVVNIFSAGLFGIALLAVSQGYLKQISGIFWWATASLLSALSWLLYSLRGVVPDFISIIIAQAVFLVALAYYFIIVAHFTGKIKRTKWVYYLIGLAVAGLLYFLYVQPNTSARVVVISFSTAIIVFASAYVLLVGKEKRPTSHWFTGIIFAFAGAFSAFRAGYHLFWNTDPNLSMFASNTMQSVTFLTSYLTSAIITFGFLLMSYDRYITQHENAEGEIKLNEERLNEAQKLAKVGSWEFDLDTNELTWSKEHYHIFEMDEMPPDKLYAECRKFIHPDDIPQLDEAIRIGKEKGHGVVYEHRIICKNGTIKY